MTICLVKHSEYVKVIVIGNLKNEIIMAKCEKKQTQGNEISENKL